MSHQKHKKKTSDDTSGERPCCRREGVTKEESLGTQSRIPQEVLSCIECNKSLRGFSAAAELYAVAAMQRKAARGEIELKNQSGRGRCLRGG